MKSAPRLIAVMRKELLQLKRDRLTFAMIVGIPVMQMLLFGYAINTDIRNLKAAVANQANSHLSREFIADLGETQVLDLRYVVNTPQEIEDYYQFQYNEHRIWGATAHIILQLIKHCEKKLL